MVSASLPPTSTDRAVKSRLLPFESAVTDVAALAFVLDVLLDDPPVERDSEKADQHRAAVDFVQRGLATSAIALKRDYFDALEGAA